MPASILRRGALALLFLSAISCEPTEPSPGDPDGFSLLIERQNAVGDRSFYTMSGNGKTIMPFIGVPADARELIPSPDGETIAYLRYSGDGFVELWTMDRYGEGRRPLLSGAYVVESAAWSPDGEKLVLSVSTETQSSNIATILENGTGLVYLTTDPLPGVVFDRDPSWSPDGSRIAFSSNASGTTRLWIMNADGSGAHQVLPASFPSSERQPVWAPDTTNFLAVVSTTAAGTGIAFVRADGTDFKHIPISPAPNDLVWMPDGRVIYIANPTGDYDVWTVDRVTGAQSQITSRRDNDVHAAVLTDVKPDTWLGFSAAATYQINRPAAVDIAVADVVTDGRADVLVLSPIFNEIRIMRGGVNGSLQAVGALFAEGDVSILRTGLVTNDAAPDIVGRADSAAYLWRGRVDGPGIATRIGFNSEVRDVVIGDLDGNGRSDIVSLIENAGQSFRLRTHTVGVGDNVVLGADLPTTRTGGQSLCAGDMNDDGYLDIAIFAGAANLSAFFSEGRGELAVATPVTAGSNLSVDLDARPYCADFNNDGKDDVALLSIGATESVSVHRFLTSGFGVATRISATASAMAVADIDRDGDRDIVMASSNTAAILIAKNRGGGTFDAPISITIPSIATAITAADLNGDNWPDVAVVDVNGALVVLLSRGRN